MVKRRIEWFEPKATLEYAVCEKDIEDGDHYCLNDTGDPMHYYCYNALIPGEKCGVRFAVLQFEKIGRGHGLRLEGFESGQPQYPLEFPIRFRFSP